MKKQAAFGLPEARVATSLVARQLAAGEISEINALNHVADLGVLSGCRSLACYFDQELERLGGKRDPRPIPMRLPCPGAVPDGHGGLRPCGELHIDEGVFATKPHHTHSCQVCGMTWRPAVVPTVGVRFLPGFKNS